MKKKILKISLSIVVILSVLTAIIVPSVYFTNLATKVINGVIDDPREQTHFPEAKSFIFGSKNHSRNMTFRVLLPLDYDSNKEYPMLMFLHGNGNQGINGYKQVSRTFMDNYLARRIKYPAIVFIPQAPKNYSWNNLSDLKDATALLMDCMKEGVLDKYSVDLDRIYITGLSMGGMGTFHQLATYPDFYAAGFSICGGAKANIAEKIKNIPIWTTHSKDDSVVPVEETREIVNALKAIGGNIQYTEYDGYDHYVWDVSYARDDIWEWMFAQSKQLR